MANTTQVRKPCTINDLAALVGAIETLTMGEAEGTILRAQLDKAMLADKQANGYTARAEAAAMRAQINHFDCFKFA